jgi:hypothetical protein
VSVNNELYPMVEISDERLISHIEEFLKKHQIDYLMNYDSSLRHWQYTLESPLGGVQLQAFTEGFYACLDHFSEKTC